MIAVYLLMNVLYLFVIPIGELATLGGRACWTSSAIACSGPRAGDIMAVVAIISLAAGINAWTFAGPRVYFAMARDKAFFKSAARVHPKYKTPAASIVAQAVLAIVLVLTGSLDCDRQLRRASRSRCSRGRRSPRSSCCARAIRTRRGRSRRWGYPWTPAIFVLVSAAIVVNAFFSDPRVTLTGSGIILAGIPLYYFFTRKKPRRRLEWFSTNHQPAEPPTSLFRQQVAFVGDLLSGKDAHIEGQRLVPGRHDLDLVLAFLEPQRLERSRRSRPRGPRSSRR